MAGIGVAGALGAVAPPEGGFGPRSGRSSIAIRNDSPKASTRPQARNTNRNAKLSSCADALRASISTDMPATPPSPPSTMAPRIATTSEENSARKKLAAPVAIPICARDTAFCSATVDTGKTVALQNAVSRAQMGIATGAANFFRALFSSLVVAILGAIVLGGLGGVAGMSVDMLARNASAHELSFAFRFVFLACGLVLAFGLSFLIAMEERPLRGPNPPSGGATAPSAPATPIPAIE